jgi:hypothetical protein
MGVGQAPGYIQGNCYGARSGDAPPGLRAASHASLVVEVPRGQLLHEAQGAIAGVHHAENGHYIGVAQLRKHPDFARKGPPGRIAHLCCRRAQALHSNIRTPPARPVYNAVAAVSQNRAHGNLVLWDFAGLPTATATATAAAAAANTAAATTAAARCRRCQGVSQHAVDSRALPGHCFAVIGACCRPCKPRRDTVSAKGVRAPAAQCHGAGVWAQT